MKQYDMKTFWMCLVLLLSMSTMVMAQRLEGFSVSEIPDSVFVRMQGKTFPEGCRMQRSDLRYLRLMHYDGTGRVCQGEMVCNKSIAQDVVEIFEELFRQHYPIERIRLMDDYDAVDEQAMRDNNSSCFCYRTVTGTQVLSKHAQGLAVDLNTLYNPYVKRQKDGTLHIEPATGRPYIDRKRSLPYKIDEQDLAYKLFRQHGFQWGGHWKSVKDYQHFEK